ncbi:MAG: hypothetical protein HDR41_00470 [Lactobacillus sp.]|nr:hypothetical protein [Lactobacillus sp.]
MTEEEKNTNQKAEEEKKEDSKPDMTVVMPEAERVTMDPEVYKEQPDYMKVFASFYISHFDLDDLEIINLYDKNHNTVDINKYILYNKHFSRKNLVKHVLQYHEHNFKALLDEIVADEGIDPESMVTYDAWEDWYEKRRGKIEGSLS